MRFTVKNREIYPSKGTPVFIIGDNADYKAQFDFDSEWNGAVKTARFVRGKKFQEKVLVNDECEVPIEVLKQGFLEVGVFSAEMTTTPCRILVKGSIKELGGMTAEPTQDVYRQIIKMIEDLNVVGVTDAQIEKAVREYLEENSVTGVDEAEVQKIIAEYINLHKSELKGDKGDKGDAGEKGEKGDTGASGKDGVDGVDGANGADGKSAYDIAKDNGFDGTEAEWLESLKAENEVSEEQIEKAVNDYLTENPADLSAICEITKHESHNVLDFADVAETSKNGITITVIDEVITLNGTATANAELNLSSNFLADGTYTFAYEILDGEFTGALMYGYQSSKYVDLSSRKKTMEIASHNRTKIFVKNGSVCDNLKIHLWAVEGSENKDWQPYGGWTEKKLNDDVVITKLEQHIADTNVHAIKETIYAEEIADIADKVFAATDNGAIVTILLSDTHIRPDEEKSVKQYKEMVANIAEITKQIPCDGVIHLGDHVNTQWWWANRYTEDLVYQRYVHDYANMLRKAKAPVYCVQGNHDGGFIPKNDDTGKTGSEYSSHSIIYRNLGTVTDKGVTRDTSSGVATPYYYVDNELTKTRMIFMASNMENPTNDVKGYHYQELLWFMRTLAEVEKDWNVLVFTHISSARFYTHLKNVDAYIELINAFNEHRATTGLNDQLSHDFSENTGKIVAEICGHYHGDSVIYADNEKAKLTCPCIEIDSGSCLVGGGVITSGDFYDNNDTNERSYFDITQHLFDVMVYRPDLGKIYMYRFGAGEDREINI